MSFIEKHNIVYSGSMPSNQICGLWKIWQEERATPSGGSLISDMPVPKAHLAHMTLSTTPAASPAQATHKYFAGVNGRPDRSHGNIIRVDTSAFMMFEDIPELVALNRYSHS
ncbi:expressed unknown protein [Seminavis robusta]|uniref:Uncharacterized protein n=1 Tax=Seminavis robusta TaxID=568900 RepID=A0A9N8HAJ2_9STRA|nr:expressed unknown protein [Seminavis robusta]|eukprot:Sro227_g092320.1 n/a (112) ;mRNA; f:55767-56102